MNNTPPRKKDLKAMDFGAGDISKDDLGFDMVPDDIVRSSSPCAFGQHEPTDTCSGTALAV